ncbi:HK97-gp10 family putative phage morphogenesis protein [Delftia sp. PS-11]|uniref:HK97-gp10 family putative phage morphogenesis protein n=1 Tax=Delftia sp. PS-11 TaxID=2767222 RepID=UPI002455F320|nr:HK97-gp10 family putative phage morphogenesis protein [Delftia sp. PS-11]KAJ8745437.1 HK97 gp10 family phage protein [Delftia sp. PS-11]
MAEKTGITGVSELAASFREVREDVARKVARRMVVAGGRLIIERARAIAKSNGSVISGAMVENIAIKRETKAPDGTAQYHVGVRHGRDQSQKVQARGQKRLVVSRGRIQTRRDNDPFYWRWVERGRRVVPASVKTGTTTYTQRLRNGRVVTRTRKYEATSLRARRRIASEGLVGHKPFIEPAFEQESDNAITAMERTLQRYLAGERKKGST